MDSGLGGPMETSEIFRVVAENQTPVDQHVTSCHISSSAQNEKKKRYGLNVTRSLSRYVRLVH
jgi:hypothetical protein